MFYTNPLEPAPNQPHHSFKVPFMNILVTGSNGQLGSEIRDLAPEYSAFGFFFTDKKELDVTNGEAVHRFMKKNGVSCLINCVGYTAVDQAEDDRPGASLLNILAARSLAEASAKVGAMMVHVSTDYVFDGKGSKPYTESDTANPRTIYGKTKLEGEIEVIFNARKALIIRTSWLYSEYGNNFLKTILEKCRTEKELRVVFDQVGTPTYARDLARAVLDIIPRVPQKMRAEVYNFSNEGVASWYDFAKAVLEIGGIKCKLVPVLSKEIQAAAQRPHYSVLDKTRIKRDFGLTIPHWRDSLAECMQKIG
jgi:dTDP-4-dehydrorhamnose reductase